MSTLYLLDAYALIYRAYYALIRSPRVNSKGLNTSAIFGFVNTLEDILRTENPDFIAVAFDPKGGTFRDEMYAEYKAQREATPEDIRLAVPIIKDLLQAYRIPILEVTGFEADDVIGTAARLGAAQGMQVTMVTPDKDYGQLVAPNISMLRPRHGGGMERWEEKEVCEKYGLQRTAQMIDYLALVGDTADNIPGCPGIGDKTAQKLLAEFDNIDNLIANAHSIKGANSRKLIDNEAIIRLSHQLVVIRTDVPLPCPIDDLRRTDPDTNRLAELFEQLEFRSHLSKLRPSATPPSTSPQAHMGDLFATADLVAEPAIIEAPRSEAEKSSTLKTLSETQHEYILVDNEEKLNALLSELLTLEKFAFDTETTSVDAICAELVGMSIATAPHRAYYIPVPENREAAQRVVEHFREVLESDRILKIGQNLKYDLTVMASYGIDLRAPMFDTMLAHYVVQPELRHNLDYLAEIYLNYRTIHIDALIGSKGKGQRSMRDLMPEEICDYACEDADVALQLYAPLVEEMARMNVRQVFDTIEMPLMPVLARMERMGVRLDTEALAETSRLFQDRLAALEADIYAMAGHEFLLTSPRQVGEVLFEELQLNPKAKKTKTGQYSTSEEVLEALRPKHEIVGKILDHRGLKKLISTYVEALPKSVNPATGHIHTSFNQAVTATGRLSSSNPNLQNIPTRNDDGREIRKAIVPEANEVFFSADYSQIELRIMAHLSGDENMIEAFRSGHDIHAATAAKIFGCPIEAVTKDQRRKAKTANFGIIYGISAFGLAQRMDVSRSEAKSLIDNYFTTFPKVRIYMDKAVEKARQEGAITTEFGRRRFLADINSGNAVVRGYAERNAINAPIQGTAADIIKLAMIAIDRRLRTENFRAQMILQVHDELNFSVPSDELSRLQEMVITEMERAFTMAVPLVADCGHGANWLEAH